MTPFLHMLHGKVDMNPQIIVTQYISPFLCIIYTSTDSEYFNLPNIASKLWTISMSIIVNLIEMYHTNFVCIFMADFHMVSYKICSMIH